MIDQRTFKFLDLLAANNSKEWMDDHRREYRSMRADVVDFAAEIIDQITQFDPAIRARRPDPATCITRLARDLRFGRGKGSYKTDYYIVVGLEGIQGVAASYCVHLEKDNCFAGAGAPNPRGADLLAYRQKVSQNFDRFEAIVTEPGFASLFPNGIQCQSGKSLKRVPVGFSRDDPAADYLKLEGFITRERVPDGSLTDPRGLETVVELLAGSKPLVDFLNG